ncbi:MAG: hypothetical protein IT345_07370 [Trueperaceae bacterium]|nr:hypothetical protein [Trueperaceae bacterium]
MPQLHLYVPEDVAERLREQARARNLSVSKYLAEIVQRETAAAWPEGYFENVIGGWAGEPLERAERLPLEERDSLLGNSH